jgi:hypothetical protein
MMKITPGTGYVLAVNDGRGNLTRYNATIVNQSREGVLVIVDMPSGPVRRMLQHDLKGWFGPKKKGRPDFFLESNKIDSFA